jgi:hypothetical protein
LEVKFCDKLLLVRCCAVLGVASGCDARSVTSSPAKNIRGALHRFINQSRFKFLLRFSNSGRSVLGSFLIVSASAIYLSLAAAPTRVFATLKKVFRDFTCLRLKTTFGPSARRIGLFIKDEVIVIECGAG